jgi:hypothetical protein
MVNTMLGLTNKNRTRNVAMHNRVIRAENPIKKVDAGLTEVWMLVHWPSQTSR